MNLDRQESTDAAFIVAEACHRVRVRIRPLHSKRRRGRFRRARTQSSSISSRAKPAAATSCILLKHLALEQAINRDSQLVLGNRSASETGRRRLDLEGRAGPQRQTVGIV